MENQIPRIIIGRLPLYLRAMIRLKKDGYGYASSHELGKLLDISAAQIRKDLSHFGELGKRGKGYEIDFLICKLNQILNTESVSAIFDKDPQKVGRKIGNLVVKDIHEMNQYVKDNEIKIAVLAIPAEYAQDVIDDLVNAGITAILNYAPIYIKTPEGVQIEHIDPAVHLQKLSYFIK